MKEKNDILYRVSQDFPEPGVKFIDLTPSLVDTKTRMRLLSKLVNYIENEVRDVDVIICPDARGFLWGMGVATLMNCSLVPVRKLGKLPNNCISTTFEYTTEYSKTTLALPIVDLKGKRVMFVDDDYATGGTYRACKRMVELAGGIFVGGAVVYDVGINYSEVYSLSRGDL